MQQVQVTVHSTLREVSRVPGASLIAQISAGIAPVKPVATKLMDSIEVKRPSSEGIVPTSSRFACKSSWVRFPRLPSWGGITPDIKVVSIDKVSASDASNTREAMGEDEMEWSTAWPWTNHRTRPTYEDFLMNQIRWVLLHSVHSVPHPTLANPGAALSAPVLPLWMYFLLSFLLESVPLFTGTREQI